MSTQQGLGPSRLETEAFRRLSPAVQSWIRKQGWTELRDIQEAAIEPILTGHDVLISSATASGKAEAALLPVCSSISDSARDHVGLLYIAPLRALINDQTERQKSLLQAIDSRATPWHSDVLRHAKQQFERRPHGALLTTPESIESRLIHNPAWFTNITRHLQYIVVDELHTFIGQERGRHLQALLHRIDLLQGNRIPRIGLSATLGKLPLAADFLRPGNGSEVRCITSTTSKPQDNVQVQVFSPPRKNLNVDHKVRERQEKPPPSVDSEIAAQLFSTLRTNTNLIFANSRYQVEKFATMLRDLDDEHGGPRVFWPHHGSLSRDQREKGEEHLRKREPATVISTATLELGIDVGSVDSIAQIDAPPSVASLKQRLGRSGRSSVRHSDIRVYVRLTPSQQPTPADRLHLDLVQTIAMIRLLRCDWVEPPSKAALHLSTLIQQVLALAAARSTFPVSGVYADLCQSGPFRNVTRETFDQVLIDLERHKLISVRKDGQLCLSSGGKRLKSDRELYTAFPTPEEWNLSHGRCNIGSLPNTVPVWKNQRLLFGGRPWRIASIRPRDNFLSLEPATGGVPPRFGGSPIPIHDKVRSEMKAVYLDHDAPEYLDSAGREFLEQGRETFRRLDLDKRPLVGDGSGWHMFPWVGDRVLHTIELILLTKQVEVVVGGPSLYIEARSPRLLEQQWSSILSEPPPSALQLARVVENKRTEKFHQYLSEELLCADYASSRLDVEGALKVLRA